MTFIVRLTPVPNNASQGGGGYLTEYLPGNTEVVCARFIDDSGNTVAPRRGGEYDDGWGPTGRHNGYDGTGLEQGSLAAGYADTGVFFSTDSRTARVPAAEAPAVTNGLAVSPVPTGAGQLDNLLGFIGPPFYAHNGWDQIQATAFGANGGSVTTNGRGSTPYLYGSPVAGPDTHYPFDKVATPACSDGINNDGDGFTDYPNDPECTSTLDDNETAGADGPTGPWQRIRRAGSEIGTGGATDCQSCAGAPVRVGIPSDLGWDLSPDNPLPASTNALRFALGELVVGREYLVEVTLRVTGLPLDPAMAADVDCAEAFGGDGAMPQGGQDNTWRYFVPAPVCVALNLQFDLDVDRLLALQADILTYRITGKNLSVDPQTGVVVTDTFAPAELQFSQVLQGPQPTVVSGTLTWPTMALAPGDEFVFEWQMTVTGNGVVTQNRARYVSNELPAPGFSVLAVTTIDAIAVIEHAAAVTPTSTTAGSNIHLTATFSNPGTGLANIDLASFARVRLPPGFSFCGTVQGCTQPMINGVGVVDPTLGPNNTLEFTGGLQDISPNGTMTLEFDATVGAGVPPGLYSFDLQTQFDDPSLGRDVEHSAYGLAPLLVDAVRSEPPVLDEPALAGATAVTGLTSEGAGATVTVFVSGNSAAPVVAGGGGAFTAAVPTLYPGQHLFATAQAPGEVESLPSSPDVVVLTVEVFSDGFESGGVGAWSAAVGGP